MSQSTLHVVEGPYLRDILDQPRAVGETFQSLPPAPAPELQALLSRFREGDLTRVVLTGMGSSHHGLYPLHLRLVDAGHEVVTVEAAELLHYQSRLLREGTLLVLVSQSGRSAEIVRLLQSCEERVSTLGVTNSADSPLARGTTAALLTRAGEEATVSCKTHLATQMALAWLAATLVEEDSIGARDALGQAQDAVEGYLQSWRAHVVEMASLLGGTRAVYYVGRGPSLGAARTAGLITKEATHRPSEGMSSAAFRHGPMEMLDDTVAVFVFAGEPRTRGLNEALVDDIRAAGGRAFLLAEDAGPPALRLPALPTLARPVVELLPVEMATLALAALDGREAGTFRVGGKVTTTE